MADVQVKTVLSADVRPYVSAMGQAARATSAADKASEDLTTSTSAAGRAATAAAAQQTAAGKAAEDAGNKAAKAADNSAQAAERSGIKWAALGTAITIVGAKMVGAIQESVAAASNLEESTTKMERVFGAQSAVIKEYAKNVGGLSTRATFDAASMMALFGQSAGLAGQQLAKFSTDMVGLSVDLASFYNSSPEEAMDAIGSALRGESESIRKYNVLIDDAVLHNRALKMGLIETTKEALTPQQKVLAVQAEILAQTSAAQGDYARTASGLANSQRDLAAASEDARAALGEALLPVMASGTQGMAKLAEAFGALPAPLRDGVAWLGLLAAVVTVLGPGLTALASGAKSAAAGLVVLRNSAIVTNVATAGLSGSLMALRLTAMALLSALGPLALALGALAAVGAGAFAGWVASEKLASIRVEHLTTKLNEATTAGRDLNEVLAAAKFGDGDAGLSTVEELIAAIKAAEVESSNLRPRSGPGGEGANPFTPEAGSKGDPFASAQIQDMLKGIDAWLAGLDPEKAGKFFNELAAKAEAAGIPLQELVDMLPLYSAALGAGGAATDVLAAAQDDAALATQKAADALKAATAAAYEYLNAQLAMSGAMDSLITQGDRFKASIMGPGTSGKASQANTEAVNKEIESLRKRDKAEEDAEIKRARRRAQAKADARADREARDATQAGVKGAIDQDKAARAGKDIDRSKQGQTGSTGEHTGTLNKSEQKALDEQIDRIRTRHQKALDERIAGLREEAKAAGAVGKVYESVSTSLDSATEGGRRNRETMRQELGTITQIAKEAEAQAIREGKSTEEAAQIGYDTLTRLRDGLIDNATQAGFTRDEVIGFLEEVKYTDKDFEILFTLVVDLDLTEGERKMREMAEKWGSLAAAMGMPLTAANVNAWERSERYSRDTLASGGEVYGPGGPREDKVPIWASAGEFVVNAQSYAANRDLVRAINGSSGAVSSGMSIGTINVSEASGPHIRASVIDGLAEAAYRHGVVR